MSHSRAEEIVFGMGVILKRYPQGIGLKTFMNAYFARYPNHKFDETFLRKVIWKTDGLLLRTEVVGDITLIFPLPQPEQEIFAKPTEPEIVELLPASVPTAHCFFVRQGAARNVARISADLGAYYRSYMTASTTSSSHAASNDALAEQLTSLTGDSHKSTVSAGAKTSVECDQPEVGEYYAVYDEEMRRYWRVRVNASLTNFVAVTYIDLGHFGEIKWPRLLYLPARLNPRNLVDGYDNAPAMTLYMLDHKYKPHGFPRSRRGLQLVLAGIDSPDIFAVEMAADSTPIKAEVLSEHRDFGGYVVRLLAPDDDSADGSSHQPSHGYFEWALAKTPALFAIDKFYGDVDEPNDTYASNNSGDEEKANAVGFFALTKADDEMGKQWRQWAADNQIEIDEPTADNN